MSAPIRARLGARYEQQLTQASANTSAALRAYLLLGFAAAGVEMAPFRREIARALAEDLAPEVAAALGQISHTRHVVPLGDPEPAPAAGEPEGDPLLAVGLDV